MNIGCPNLNCPSSQNALKPTPASGRIIRSGYYYRRSDSRWIQRFLCLRCNLRFSKATLHPCFGQKKRRLNHALKKLLCSGVSQRRAARHLGINLKTVARKLRFLAKQARLHHEKHQINQSQKSITQVQFDDLETSEHSKCKPLSISLAVEPESRKILAFQVSQMPAKGLLSKIAKRKYGDRPDQRFIGWDEMMKTLKPVVHPRAVWTSDKNPHYSKHLKAHHPQAIHAVVKSRRGCVAGQGELKKIGFDPIFSLNHTCAMMRANINRLFRRTWCTTKKRECLIDHIWIYLQYHNSILTR